MFLHLYMSYIWLAILRGGYAWLVYEFSIGGVFFGCPSFTALGRL